LSIRFQADADMNPEIGLGLRRREPAIDFRSAAGIIPHGALDPEVLQVAAEAGRVLLSRDVATMQGHFERFIEPHHSPGLLLIPSSRSIWVRNRRSFDGLVDLVSGGLAGSDSMAALAGE
jgi:hypothetical protein